MILLRKMSDNLCFKCEAIFSTERLKIFKCTWIKCLVLETNLASSVKQSIFSSKENEQVSSTTDKTILLLLVQPDEHFEKREHGNAWLVL